MSASATDDAVLAADLRRRAEDLFGGTGRAAWNLVKDFAFGMERYIGQKGLSPVSAAVGSAGGAIAAYSLNPALGMATLFGASKMEIYDEVLAETGDRDAAHLVSDIFREQVTDATGDHKLAADAADMVFAMSRVAGARLGLTPEQHLNLCPIQVTPQNALERVRSSAQVMDAFDNRRLNLDISRAAQNVLMQPERGPIEETREQSVTRGVLAIERILAVLSLFRHGGKETWLLTGWEDTSPDDAEGVNPGRTYAQTPSGIQGRVGAGGIFAKYRRLWAKSSSSAASPDSTSTLIAEAGDSSGTGNAGELGTKAAIPTIPAEGTDVNAWNQSALDNLLRQSGVSEEQADIFRQYVESLLQSGEDVIDAQALGRDLTAALTSAEGLEQAAAGLERILADPASITDAVFRAAGVEAPTGQQGIAEPQRRMADPRRRADEFRTFYKSPEALSRVRQATAGDRGLLGFAQSPIETLYQEDQRPGDAARAAKIEQLKKREPLDLRGVAPVASKAAVKDVFRGFGPVINRMDGRSVIFPAKSAGKIEKHRGFDMKQIVAAFARLFADSIPMFSESEIRRKGHKPHNNIAAYHHYVSKFTRPVDNRDSAAYYIRFIVQEMKSRKGNGENLVHSAFVSDVSIYEESALSGWGWESPVIAESGASYDHKLAKWLFSVKPENDGNIDPPHQAAGAPEGARGAVTFPRFPNAPATIRLFNSRQNRSTILHELFHVYFRELERAVKAEGATDQVHADHETLNAAVDGDLTSTDPDARTAAEERAATMFERYLSEGRAPTPFLADAFARLRTWMANIYRNVGAFVGLDVSPEVRGVFDRMLAGEAEIAYARQYYDDLATLSAPAGATEAQKRDIDRKAARARTASEERHIARMAREYLIHYTDAKKGAFKRHAGNAARAEAKGDNIKAAEEYRLMRMAHYGIRAALEARREFRGFDAFRRFECPIHESSVNWRKIDVRGGNNAAAGAP